jgi:hypothetical protein
MKSSIPISNTDVYQHEAISDLDAKIIAKFEAILKIYLLNHKYLDFMKSHSIPFFYSLNWYNFQL